jgi:hypothetical protein
MITLFELKHTSSCRCLYRIPYFIKNLILLLILGFVLVLNYLMIYRRDTVVIQDVYKMMAGLDSETFNFLSSNDEMLMIKSKIKSISATRAKQVDFYSSCVSLSRPCLLPSLAKVWPAYNSWAYVGDGYFALN